MKLNGVITNTVTVYAPYTVTLDRQSGTGGSASVSDVCTGFDMPSITVPTREGYTFGGYYSETSGNGTKYYNADGTSARYWNQKSESATATLYAKWTLVNYTISYDLGGGSVALENPTNYTIESAAITLNNPTKDGYTFAGWTGTDLGSASTSVTIASGSTGNRSYTATWTANQYTITFDTDGGSAIAAITQDYGTAVTAPANPTKPGYIFGGWDTEIPTTMPAENMTITATWTADPAYLTPNGDKTAWTLAAAPAFDFELQAEYYTDLLEDDVNDYSSISGPADVWVCRTLKAGSYNTFASPVSIDAAGITALGITAVKQLDSSDLTTDGILTLNFTPAETIEAGKPYLVKVSADKEVGAFDLATVSGTTTPTETDAVTFIPTLGATTLVGEAKSILFLGAGNKLYNPEENEGEKMKGFRAYFQLKAAVLGAKVRSFVLDFGEGDLATGIISVAADPSAAVREGIYDLQGRKIVGQPTQKGIYIVNGKKTVIK